MKNFLIILIAITTLFPFIAKSQANLGTTLSEIKADNPGKTFTTDVTKEGTKYAYADMQLGVFYYYFDNTTNLSYLCLQVPYNLKSLNTQVELYNKNYVTISENSWKAYLEGGGTLKINLEYHEKQKIYIFYYSN
jgi:hypothetical protein